ncbi:PAS domain S-box protein [Natrinema halophilum]|uniref:PAS domain S-box protein n=1 Tax=Natrinema halophilum TaxID=1699371 RepID=A0A7D5KYV6_9EURY|nr:PAS domain S-box protein [Natrinema halophilum]QLG47780.1 PAS domain S-box protein [Natrinema halophilum]
MARGLEESEVIPVSVLAVGSSEWLQTATAGLADISVTVTGSVSAASDLTDEQLEAANCVLTDDRGVLETIDGKNPVLYAAEPAANESIERLHEDGATDVIRKTTIHEPPLLAHRLRRTVQFSPARPHCERPAEWYRTVIEQSSDLLVVTDDVGDITYVSPAVERDGGFDKEELCGSRIFDYVHPDDTQEVRNKFEAVSEAETGSTRTVEYRCQHADGTWYVHKASLTNCLEDDPVEGIVASIRDITEYHRIEQELSESFKRVTDAFYALDSEWRFSYVNDRALELIGLDRTDLLGERILDVFPEIEGTELEAEAMEAMEQQESRTIEAYFESYDAWIEARIYPSQSGISVYWRDVTERVEREQDLAERTERLQTLVENVPVVLFVLDEDGTFTLSEGRGLENIGFDSDQSVGTSFFDLLEEYPDICSDAWRAFQGESVHSRREIESRVFEMWYRPITDDGDVDRVIGVASDVTERVQYQDTLNALHEATSHLLTVESKQAACEYIVDVATDVLDLASVVYRFDDQQNELVPAASSTDFESTFGSPPRLEPNNSIAWEAFVTGEPSAFDDVRTADSVTNESTAARSGLYVPLGEHGVLVALSSTDGEYDTDTVELAELFATAAEAALDRIGRSRRLRDREHELKQQNEHLERLNAANDVRQEIEQLLLMAESRSEIERGIPEQLVDFGACSLAWIGEPDPSGNHLRPRFHAGHERGYLDEVTVTTVDDSAAEPAGRAARTQTPIYVDNVAESVHDGKWRGTALSRNFQSVYAVPLMYDDYLYGVLTIYGEERNAFDETLRSTLAELGETIAYAIDAVKRKKALLGDNRTEVELEVASEATLCQLATYLETPVTYEGATDRADGSQIVFVAVEEQVDKLEDATDHTACNGVSELSVIAEHDGGALLQLQLNDPFLGAIADTHGARLREFVAEGSSGQAIVDVPDGVAVREVLSGINRSGPSVWMIARREQTSDESSTLSGPARNTLLKTFTDRQREVVQTAYHGGFFEWPRRATGEEIAGSLDISSPAFHKHIRSAERKLFAALFDGQAADGVK